jgi:hypothetical protein
LKDESIFREAVILVQLHPCWGKEADLMETEQHPERDQVGGENRLSNRVLGNGNLCVKRMQSDTHTHRQNFRFAEV